MSSAFNKTTAELTVQNTQAHDNCHHEERPSELTSGSRHASNARFREQICRPLLADAPLTQLIPSPGQTPTAPRPPRKASAVESFWPAAGCLTPASVHSRTSEPVARVQQVAQQLQEALLAAKVRTYRPSLATALRSPSC